jgi:hypothetical protein
LRSYGSRASASEKKTTKKKQLTNVNQEEKRPMKKLLAMLAMVTLMGAVANAAKDEGTEFKFGGEVRERYGLTQNPTFVANGAPTEQRIEQRNQFHVNAITSDKLQAYFNFMHSALWGGAAAVPSNGNPNSTTVLGGNNGTGTTTSGTQSALQVSEAWLWWKVSDMFSIKAGRATASYGDGLVLSKNDFLGSPYNFDGVMGRFSWDFLDLDVAGVKLAETGIVNPVTATGGTGLPNGTDAETNAFIVHASFKNLPDVLKNADLFVAQVNGDPISGLGAGGTPAASGGNFAPGISNTVVTNAGTGNTPTGSYGLTTYGAHIKGDVAIIDYRVDAAFQSGKQKTNVAGGADMNYGGSMYDLQVGANFPEFMKGRLYVGYHVDSGDDTTATGSGDKNEQYQPMFYDVHEHAGRANVFGFGNLTDIVVGLTAQPGDDTWLGVEADLLSRTTEKSAPTLLSAQQGSAWMAATGLNNANNTEKALGTEIDVWAKHNYGHGLSMLGQFSYVMLGNYFTPGVAQGSSATYAGTVGKNAWQLLAQAQYNF